MGQGRTLTNGMYRLGRPRATPRKVDHTVIARGGFAYPLRKGYATRKLPQGRGGAAPYALREYAVRALKRADRWVRRYGDDPKAEPPRHIAINADLAARQLGR